jgi:energy-coupling factor transport system permease protein
LTVQRSLDTRAWLIWLAGMLLPSLLTFNPWIQLLIIGIALVLWPGDAPDQRSGFLRLNVLLRIAVAALIIGGLFNVLVVHYGSTVIVTLPDSLPIIGGILTLEALVFGILNALRVISIIFAFATFSRLINYADLLRLTPSALFELGLMLSIGVTLVPFILRSFNEIRESQALRGHRAKGIRGLLPLFTPLVASGLEHALALAESMEARGYGAVQVERRVLVGQAIALLSLLFLLVLLAIVTLVPISNVIMTLLIVAVVGLMFFGLRVMASGSGRTRFRRQHWGWQESIVTVGASVAMIALLVADRTMLVYDPYRLSVLGLPTFSPWLGIALLGLALPALVKQ